MRMIDALDKAEDDYKKAVWLASYFGQLHGEMKENVRREKIYRDAIRAKRKKEIEKEVKKVG